MMMRCKQEIKRQKRPDSKYAWSKQRKSDQKATHPFSQNKRKSLIQNESKRKKNQTSTFSASRLFLSANSSAVAPQISVPLYSPT